MRGDTWLSHRRRLAAIALYPSLCLGVVLWNAGLSGLASLVSGAGFYVLLWWVYELVAPLLLVIHEDSNASLGGSRL